MWHIDHRPNSFSEMIGNEEVITALQRKLEDEKRPHTYLFSGESGCGKTTAARIMARELGASESTTIEINCSNENGIDTARQIIDQMQCKPFDGNVLVFVLDELHMTSKNFMNALLKPLEDVTPWTYFFLCTTNPEKLLSTIKSRSSKFQFQPPTDRDVIRLMRKILKEENKEISTAVLKEIALKSDCKPRECLTTLETVIELEDEDKQLKAIQKSTNDSVQTIELCRALLKENSWSPIASILKNIDGEPESIRRAVLGYMTSVLLNAENPRAALVIDCFSDNYYDNGKAGLIKSCYEVFVE